MILPRVGRRKQRQRKREREGEGEGEVGEQVKKEKAEAEWQEVRSLMDPNPQLKGVDPGKYTPKVCCIAIFAASHTVVKISSLKMTELS